MCIRDRYNTGNYHCSLNEIDTLIDNYISVFLASNHPERNNLDYRQIVRNCLEDIIVSQIIGIHAINHNPDGLTIEEGASVSYTHLDVYKRQVQVGIYGKP